MLFCHFKRKRSTKDFFHFCLEYGWHCSIEPQPALIAGEERLFSAFMKKRSSKIEWWLDALSLVAVLQYAGYRFLQSTMFTFYYSYIYKVVTLGLMLLFGGVRYLYKIASRLKTCADKKETMSFLLHCAGAWILALPFLYVGWVHDYKFLMLLPICCMCLYDMEAGKVFRSFFWVIGILLTATVLCSLSGTVRSITRTRAGVGASAAYGIINTTDFASYFIFLLLSIWCGIRNKGWAFSVSFALAAAALSYAAYLLADSRTVLCIGAFMAFLILWDCAADKTKKLRQINKGIQAFSIIAFPLMGFLVFFLTYSYAQQMPWAINIDHILSGRLKVTIDPYRMYGIQALGNDIKELYGRGGTLLSFSWSSGYGYIDVAYAMVAIRYGWVVSAVLTGLWVWMTAMAIRKGSNRVALAMMVLAFHAFSEARILDINYNIFLVMPFCAFTKKEEAESKKAVWSSVAAGAAVAGCVFLALPYLVSWLRTFFASQGWNSGTKQLNALIICVGIAALSMLLWKTLSSMVISEKKMKAALAFGCVVLITVVGALLINDRINREVQRQTERLNGEEKIIRLVQEAATQPVYAAEPSELYIRRYGGFSNHVSSTELIRTGTVFTDADVEVLSIISAGGVYTQISDDTGVYTFDQAVVAALANEGYEWTPGYVSVRNVNLKDAGLFNNMKADGSLTLMGPTRIVTANMETDQFSGQYVVEFKLSELQGTTEDPVAVLEVMGESDKVLIDRAELKASDFENGQNAKSIKYSINGTPNISYAISVPEGISVSVDDINWRRLPQEKTAGAELQEDGHIILTTNKPDNRFSLIHFQLLSAAKQYLCSFGSGEITGLKTGDYVHNYPSGLYYLLLKGNTNSADEWIRQMVYLNEGDRIHYSYYLEELTSDHIVIYDLKVEKQASNEESQL